MIEHYLRTLVLHLMVVSRSPFSSLFLSPFLSPFVDFSKISFCYFSVWERTFVCVRSSSSSSLASFASSETASSETASSEKPYFSQVAAVKFSLIPSCDEICNIFFLHKD